MWEVSLTFHEDGTTTKVIKGTLPWEEDQGKGDMLDPTLLEGFTVVTECDE